MTGSRFPCVGLNKIDVSSDRSRIFRNNGPHYVQGSQITFSIPFVGIREIFDIKPSQYDSAPPRGVVTDSDLYFSIAGEKLSKENVLTFKDRWIASVKQYLDWYTNDFNEFVGEVGISLQHTVNARRKQILERRELLESINIPLRRRDDTPESYIPVNVKRIAAVSRPVLSDKPFRPEPALPEEEYQHIIKIMQSMVKVMERSPETFSRLGEEALRDHFLVQLNGHYHCSATGETFNHRGKTGILIRSEDKNIFIAECKFWTGESGYLKTIDQLLGYLTWRDVKTAILVFNKNKDFTSVLKSISSASKAHANFRKEDGVQDETIFRYRFHQKEDSHRDIILSVMAFNC